jgi:Rrf2 family protein
LSSNCIEKCLRVKLQTRTMLALYSVMEAASRPNEQVTAADIAARYGVSQHHLAKVMLELGRFGFLDSLRGAGGGYRFSGNPRRLTLLDVIERFEDIGARTPMPGELQTERVRAIGLILTEIDEITKATLRSISFDTLMKLVERERNVGIERN